jgi:hypothetical protein
MYLCTTGARRYLLYFFASLVLGTAVARLPRSKDDKKMVPNFLKVAIISPFHPN